VKRKDFSYYASYKDLNVQPLRIELSMRAVTDDYGFLMHG
jgi:hypothetical protein